MAAKSNFLALVKKKQGFLLQIYGTLIFELLVTFFIVYSFRNHPRFAKPSKLYLILYFVLAIILILILSFVPMPPIVKFLIFTLLAIVIGAMLYSTTFLIPRELITQALTGAISIFIAMSVVGIILASLGFDLGWLGMILLGALIGLIVASLILLLFDKNKSSLAHKTVLIIGLILFGVYVIYETNIILQENYDQDFISASVSLYLDFINIFSRILALEQMES
jgi:FtsH-binding integral membrane protein